MYHTLSGALGAPAGRAGPGAPRTAPVRVRAPLLAIAPLTRLTVPTSRLTLLSSVKLPGPARTRVPALSSTVSLSPDFSVTLAFAASFLPWGYADAEGPLERTMIDWAWAAFAASPMPAATTPTSTLRVAPFLAENIALSFACRAQPFEQVAQGVVLPELGERGCESLHKR